jgi:aminoglycoside 6'-N-acetyltransferase
VYPPRPLEGRVEGVRLVEMKGPAIPVLRGERVSLRPVREDDLAALLAMLAEPEVARWFGSWNAGRIQRDLLARQEDEAVLAIEVDDTVAGVLMVGEEEEPDYRHASIDLALNAAHQGRGLGPEAMRLAVEHMFERGHHRFTIDPAVANERAIRAYASLGFRPVGVMRQYERAPDGTWRDGLLMDLLAEEYAAKRRG